MFLFFVVFFFFGTYKVLLQTFFYKQHFYKQRQGEIMKQLSKN